MIFDWLMLVMRHCWCWRNVLPVCDGEASHWSLWNQFLLAGWDTRGPLEEWSMKVFSHRWSFKIRSPKTKERLKILKQSQTYLLCACLTNLTALHVPTYMYDCMTIFMWSFVLLIGGKLRRCIHSLQIDFVWFLLFCSAIIIHKEFLKRSSWASEHVILGTQAGNIIEHDSVIYEADTATEDVWKNTWKHTNMTSRF